MLANAYLVEEFVLRFTHSIAMDWMIPGVPPTGRKIQFETVEVMRDLTNASVPARTFAPADLVGGNSVVLLCRLIGSLL